MSETSGWIYNMPTNENNSTSSRCLEFSREVAGEIFVVRTSSWLVVILPSLVMIGVVVITKRLRSSLQSRLLTYLLATGILHGICQILEQLPVEVTEDDQVVLKNGLRWRTACVLFAFLDMVTIWMSNFFLIWFLLLVLRILYYLIQSKLPPHRNSHTKVREGIGVATYINHKFISHQLYSFYQGHVWNFWSIVLAKNDQ
jgi:hypothetical protein